MPVLYNNQPFVLFIAVIALGSVIARKLTPFGALTGAAIAVLIFTGAGYTGIAMLAAFFLLGTAATIWKKKEKSFIKKAGDQSTRRNAGQVLANGGLAGLTGMAICFFPGQAAALRIMMAASLASAMADTLSSELGMIYGRRFFHIISWKRERGGLDGAVSVEGTLIGIIGSVMIAAIYIIGFGGAGIFTIIIIAGTAGNIADSILGALLERKHYLNNDAVNFLSTVIAAALAGTLWLT